MKKICREKKLYAAAAAERYSVSNRAGNADVIDHTAGALLLLAEMLTFNSQGACPICSGTDMIRTVDHASLVPDESLSMKVQCGHGSP